MKKLFSIFCCLLLSASMIIKADMPTHNLLKAQYVESQNKQKHNVQGFNTLATAKEQIEKRRTQLQSENELQKHSLLNKVKKEQLRTRAMVSLAQQNETITHNLGYSIIRDFQWGQVFSKTYMQATKDDGNYIVYFYVEKGEMTGFDNNEWLNGSEIGTYTALYSYSDGEWLNISSVRAQIKNYERNRLDLDMYYTVTNGTVYKLYLSCDIASGGRYEDHYFYYDDASDASYSFTQTQLTCTNNGDLGNGTIGWDLTAYNSSKQRLTEIWLYADPSFGGSAYKAGSDLRWNFYFGNLDPWRMVANRVYFAPFAPEKKYPRVDPYDNQRGEIENGSRGLRGGEFRTRYEMLWHEESEK